MKGKVLGHDASEITERGWGWERERGGSQLPPTELACIDN